eukprot:PhF_6_TR6885/c0_g1_i1/m.9927/K00461/ALOX5; arachidonate 5-lipoxygenase
MGNVVVGENCACIDRVPKVTGIATMQAEPQPLRCCLPQFDPFREQRTKELHEATHIHPIMKERQVSKSQDIDRDRSFKDDNFVWKPRANGLPFEFQLPPWEELQPHIKEARSFAFQVDEVIREFMGTAGESIARMGPDHPRRHVSSFAEYYTVFFKEPGKSNRGFPKPEPFSKHWTTDDEFTRFRFTGPHPCHLRIITRKSQIPTSFEVKDDMLIGLMEQFDTIEDAMKESRLYMVDYSELLFIEIDDLMLKNLDEEEKEALRERLSERGSNAFLCNPVALFFKTTSGKLQPIAIQLWGKTTVKFLEKHPINPVFTPCDNFYAWNMAKMYFNCADMHAHFIVSLSTMVYFITAVVQIFAERNLSVNHPLRQMLWPHIRQATTFFERMTATLVSDDGPLQGFLRLDSRAIKELMCRQWRKYDFNNKAFVHDVLDRTNDIPLPGYNFVEDGRLWWKHIYTYVKQVLSCYYSCPDDIDDDEELKSWIHEMSNNITRVMELHPARREEPIAFNITSIIFTATVMNSALTHNAYDHYAHVGAFPGNMTITEAIRKNKDAICLADLVAALPDKRSALMQIATSYVMSGKNSNLGGASGTCFGRGIAEGAFRDKRLQASVDAFFTTKLEELKNTIEERNKNSDVPYVSLLPQNVRNTFAMLET